MEDLAEAQRDGGRIVIYIVCLVWVGVQLGAPTWFYILLGFAAMCRLLKIGIDLGEKK